MRRGQPQVARPMRVRKGGQCSTGKIRYLSSLDAALALGRAQANRRARQDERVEARHYRCPSCSGYHLTSRGAPPA